VFRRHDLDDVVELFAQQLQGLVVDRLGGRHHLAEREEHLHQSRGIDVDLFSEVGQRGTACQTDGLAVAIADPHATDGRGLHRLELLATSPLRLATPTRRAPRTPEGTLGLTTLSGTTPTAEAAGTTATTGRSTGATTGGTA